MNIDPTYKPSPLEIYNTCLSFRHDFGLLPKEEQLKTHNEALWWYEAWQKTFEDSERAKAYRINQHYKKEFYKLLSIVIGAAIVFIIYYFATRG